jgi:ABC-2 type transport system permease protein
MSTHILSSASWTQKFSAALAEAHLRLITASRNPGQLIIEIILPLLMAGLPMLLGRATAGATAADNFQSNTGTSNFVAFLLIGTNVFVIVSQAFANVAYWLRFEQETGTLEAVYLTPTSGPTLIAGVALYSALRNCVTGFVAYVIGCLIFRVNPFQGNLLLALVFIAIGLIPIYAIALLFGALVLKVKECNMLIGVMQWIVGFLMGALFPITVLPAFLRFVALAFPPTWMVNGVRSALLGVGFFFQTWYYDLVVLSAFMIFAPLLGVWVFQRVERGIRHQEGIGQF